MANEHIPKHANIIFSAGENLIEINQNNFSRLTVERVVSDAADKFTLNVLDDAAYSIERVLLSGRNHIEFKYFDDDNHVQESFSGNITKMNSSFINNRNMLTLEGYVGLSIQDKYELKSRNWNRAVLFPWKEVLDDWTKENALKLIANNEIYQDNAGQFYTFSHKKKDEGKNKVIAGEEVIIPVRPSEIIKLMATGGTLDTLMMNDIEKYKNCTTFYNLIKETRKDYNYVQEHWVWDKEQKAMVKEVINDARDIDMPFLRAFLKKHDRIKPNGWIVNSSNIKKTKLVEKDLSQTLKSDVKYIYDVLCNVSITDDKNNENYNYMFKVDSNNNVTFKPIKIRNDKGDKTLVYYGDFQSEDSSVKLLSFSADTNILTAFLTGDNSSAEHLSTLNLVTGEDMSEASSSAESDVEQTFEAQYRYKYETRLFTTTKNNLTANATTADFKASWGKAMAMNYKAEATVVGYTGLAPGNYVDIIIAPNVQTGKYGEVKTWYHHTSGLYYITKMTNTIEAGKMTSNLELIKNVASLGQSSASDEYIEKSSGKTK